MKKSRRNIWCVICTNDSFYWVGKKCYGINDKIIQNNLQYNSARRQAKALTAIRDVMGG